MSAAKKTPSADIMNVREIIECAFGDFENNTVNFKLVQTVLLLIARQLRVLERRVEVEMDPYLSIPPANTLSITEVKIHATEKNGKKPKQADAAKPGGAGGGGGAGARTEPGTKAKKPERSGSDKTSTDKTFTDKTSTDKMSTDKTSTDKRSTDKTSTDKRSTDKTFTDKTSTDKTSTNKRSTDKSSTDKTSIDLKTSTDKTTTATDKTSTDKTTSSTDKTTTASTDRTSTDKTSSLPVKTSTDKTTSSTDKQTTTSTERSSADKTTSSTDKTSTDKTTSSTDKPTTTSTDRTSTDKTTSSTDKTSTEKTTSSTDKTTTSTDRTSTDKSASSDRTTKEKTSRTAARVARGQKPYSNHDILSALEEQRERELRIIHQRADSFEEPTKSPTPMASVSSIPKQYEKLLVVKKVLSKETRSGETGQRSPHISVVTQEQFEELANAVRKLEKKFLPIGTPGFPEHAELMEELRKGASLTDAMAALQLSARLEATEKVLGQMITMVTDLASQTPDARLDESKELAFVSTAGIEAKGQSQIEVDAGVAPSTPGFDEVSRKFEAGPEFSSIGGAAKSSKSIKEGFPSYPTTPTMETTSRVDTIAAASKTQTAMGFALDEDEPSDEEERDSVYVSFSELKKAARLLYNDLLKKLKTETTHTTSTAETAYRMSVNLESKLDRAIMVTSRMNELENVVKQFADQVIALDTGLSSQMTSYQEQLTQMQHDLEIGVETISDLLASASGDVEAVAELHSNFTNLQTDLEVMAFRQKELRDSQDSTAYDLESLWKEIEMLRDTKSDREEVTDALRDKAGLGQLNGLVAIQQFEAVRGDFEKRIGAAYDKFNNQEQVWQRAIDDLVKVINEKGDLLQVQTLKEDINQHLNRIKDRMQVIADIVGEPKSAMVSRKVFRDTSCLSCGSPAHMDLEEPNKVPALPKFPSGREPAEGAEGESQTKGGGDSKLCYPDMPIPHPRDPRSHICKRYCGGSHTIVTDGLNRTLPGLVGQPANRPFNTAPGTDGKLYMVDEQSKKVPCLACNIPTPSPVTPEPEPPKQDPIDSFDEFGDISFTPPAQNFSYY